MLLDEALLLFDFEEPDLVPPDVFVAADLFLVLLLLVVLFLDGDVVFLDPDDLEEELFFAALLFVAVFDFDDDVVFDFELGFETIVSLCKKFFPFQCF